MYLNPPEDPLGLVVSGVAVLDSGEYMGQRVQFDRDVCSAFGHSLKRADLGKLFSYGKKLIHMI